MIERIKTIAIAFLTGVIVALVLLMRKIKPTIFADNYFESVVQRVGKIKQRGENNNQDYTAEIETKTKREIRREKRITARMGKKTNI